MCLRKHNASIGGCLRATPMLTVGGGGVGGVWMSAHDRRTRSQVVSKRVPFSSKPDATASNRPTETQNQSTICTIFALDSNTAGLDIMSRFVCMHCERPYIRRQHTIRFTRRKTRTQHALYFRFFFHASGVTLVLHSFACDKYIVQI